MKKRKKRCHYYCDGYCFWHGDTGEVCDTNNNEHDGYCPMRESDEELEHIADIMIAEQESLCPNPVSDMFESGHNSCDLCGKSQAFYYGCEDCGTVFCEDCQKEFYKCPVCGSEHLA